MNPKDCLINEIIGHGTVSLSFDMLQVYDRKGLILYKKNTLLWNREKLASLSFAELQMIAAYV